MISEEEDVLHFEAGESDHVFLRERLQLFIHTVIQTDFDMFHRLFPVFLDCSKHCGKINSDFTDVFHTILETHVNETSRDEFIQSFIVFEQHNYVSSMWVSAAILWCRMLRKHWYTDMLLWTPIEAKYKVCFQGNVDVMPLLFLTKMCAYDRASEHGIQEIGNSKPCQCR